jgi:photosystem II stability/assembly factor-like uncharacterized protein
VSGVHLACGRGARLFGVLALAPALALAPPAVPAAGMIAAPGIDAAAISGLGARNIGSAAMSGRVAAIAARQESDGRVTLYVGAASGGVWRSYDGGTTFEPVFDRQPVQSIGAIALDPSNPKTVWVGSGESWTRNSVSVGDGIYRSIDGGDTWQNMGLASSERINKIVVDPRDGNTVYACVPGALWSDSADRGLYKTSDGGRSWSLVLKGPNLSTGCSGLTMDPRNSQRLFAGLWDFRRQGWTFRSGGEGAKASSGSGLFLSEDGGRSWQQLDAHSAAGLPPAPWGRLDVVIAPSSPDIVYAVIEGVHSGLYRSADGGKTWEARDASQRMVWRPFYFSKLIVDPTNAERVFKPNLLLIASEDGGRSFSVISAGTHGDHHDVWVNPSNPQHVITGDDGGLWISHDGGNKWSKANNLPVSQFYHVSVDDKDPYQVYGGLQDNSSWAGDSAYPGGITNSRWENLYDGDGFYTFADPADPDYAYAEYQGGHIARVNRHTLEKRNIQPTADFKEKLRWNWNTPIALSPTNRDTLYIGAQFLFRSGDHGQSWSRISPDLTSNDPEKQKQEESGGITVDNSSAEMHTTIYSIAESPRDERQIWVGTDDGNVQLTRDGGAHWSNLRPNIQGLPAASWVSSVSASPSQAGTGYATFDRHTYGDMTPWAYRTTDFGQTWTRIVTPAQGVRGYAHILREDPAAANVLYLGTEFGLWISIDAGANWAQFKGGNFPAVAVRDLAIQERDGDLVIATHGRGIWIIDDLTALRALTPKVLASEVSFLPVRPAQQRILAEGGWPEGDASFAGENPAPGALISYYQKTRHVFGRLKLDILDPSGRVIDTLPAAKRKGINRVVWSMQAPPPRVPTAAQPADAGRQGPRLLPGDYTVRLTKAGKQYETRLAVTLDRRAKFNLDDRKLQFAGAMRAHALFGRMTDLAERLAGLKALAESRKGAPQLSGQTLAQIEKFTNQADLLRKEIVATKEGGAITGEERLREHLDDVYGALLSFEGRPGDYQVARIATLERELAQLEDRTKALVDQDLPALNEALKREQLEPLTAQAAARLGAQNSAIDTLRRLGESDTAVAAAEDRD